MTVFERIWAGLMLALLLVGIYWAKPVHAWDMMSDAEAHADANAEANAISQNTNANNVVAAGGAATAYGGEGGNAGDSEASADAAAIVEDGAVRNTNLLEHQQTQNQAASARSEGSESNSSTTVITRYRDRERRVYSAPASFAGLCHGGAGATAKDISVSAAATEEYCRKLRIADAYRVAGDSIVIEWPEPPVPPSQNCEAPSLDKGADPVASDAFASCLRLYESAVLKYRTLVDAHNAAFAVAEAEDRKRQAYYARAFALVGEADAWVESMDGFSAVGEASRQFLFPAAVVLAAIAIL